jgi:hypothetical protein
MDDVTELRAAIEALEKRVAALEAFPGQLVEAFQNGLAEAPPLLPQPEAPR